MSFETDKQTLDDLNILGKYKNNSVYSLFDGIVTRGGERLMEEMFVHPLTDADEINRRVAIFRYFRENELAFPGSSSTHDVVDEYLGGASGKHWIFGLGLMCKTRFMEMLGNDERFGLWREQIQTSVCFLREAKVCLERLNRNISGNPLEGRVKWALNLLQDKPLSGLLTGPEGAMTFGQMFRADRLLRSVLNKELTKLVVFFNEIDVYIVVGRVARERNFCFPVALADGDISMEIMGLHHLAISGAISNEMSVTKQKNIFFLTGANMAGKSTLMKSFGIAVYMAHMGFPVAAREMHFIIQDGMYTSINVPDNINMGYSHFYAEVLRVKNVAIEVSLSKRLVVIFDELFKGTNVKDAYDATLAVTEALAKRRSCSFVISTHIIEVGHNLGEKCDNITFAYLPTVMKGCVPTYTYKLEPGITSDKHGMIIINNERVIDILRGKV